MIGSEVCKNQGCLDGLIGFDSGHDFAVHEFIPAPRGALYCLHASEFFVSLSAPPQLMFWPSLSKTDRH